MLTRFEQYLKSVIECYATQPGKPYNLPDDVARTISDKLLKIAKEESNPL